MKTKGDSPMKRLLLVFICAALALSSEHLAHAQVVIVANLSVGQNDITHADVRDIFSGATTTLKGASIKPVLLKQGPVHEEMLARYIGKSDSAFRASWRSMLFSGQGVLPKTLDAEAAVVEYVARTPGAIGYIARSTPRDGVKILAVR
jgi:ABC-type phosphate transport system substrate-binding protein